MPAQFLMCASSWRAGLQSHEVALLGECADASSTHVLVADSREPLVQCADLIIEAVAAGQRGEQAGEWDAVVAAGRA